MPTYDYKCNACKHAFEQFQSMKDVPLKKCPVCKKPKLERLIGTGGAVIFKGSGFYQTDYRNEAYTKAAKADAPAESKPVEATPTPVATAESKSSKNDARAPKEKTPSQDPSAAKADAPAKKSPGKNKLKD